MKIQFLILILAAATSVTAQNYFNITYQRPGYEYVSGLVQDTNHDFIISGTSGSFPDDVNAQALLLRIDTNGVVIWRKYYGTPESENGKNVVVMPNGDLVFCGYSDGNTPNDYDMFVTRTTNSGDELWTKYYGGSSWDFANYIDKTLDGGFVLVGETYSFGSGQKDAYLLRLDAAGDTLWTRVLGGSQDDGFNGVKCFSDGSIVTIGYMHDEATDQKDVSVIKWDNNGDTVWTRTYGGTRDDIGNFVDETQSGEVIIAGDYRSDPSSEGDIDILNYRLDADGNTICSELNPAFGGETGNETGEIIRETSDGGLMNFGTVDAFQDVQQIMLNKGNAQCVGNYNRLMGTQPFYAEELGGAIVTLDGGFAIAGHTDFGEGPSNVFLIRTTATPDHTLDGVTGINEDIETNGIQIYPNPLIETVNVSCPGNIISGRSLFRISDLNGRVIQEGKLEKNLEIDASGLNSGLYFLMLETDEGPFVKRLVKN